MRTVLGGNVMTNRMDTEALRALKERLRNGGDGWLANNLSADAADAIEQLEAELAAARSFIFNTGREMAKLESQLAAEMALADRLYASPYGRNEESARAAYRKARGL